MHSLKQLFVRPRMTTRQMQHLRRYIGGPQTSAGRPLRAPGRRLDLSRTCGCLALGPFPVCISFPITAFGPLGDISSMHCIRPIARLTRCASMTATLYKPCRSGLTTVLPSPCSIASSTVSVSS
ncbi:hypothetical protein PYCCODRAFT_1006552 [Trametes coccinea BRFM310]|uniref:Uncharacterized protein n=1 Tax=Trametes coccinea (strain BRFM310) TaxID=1353009 RepID=A0A1Y2ICC7_TRAC3|nr:hypothetical protein PYCCODRAFT_1006552 [Trametes coccinea BRFM310]